MRKDPIGEDKTAYLLRVALLDWYETHRRTLPWRALPDQKPNPYFVWLSEIMLQQTTVATVGSYFTHFTDEWPTVQDLASASLDDVLVAWQGLGYYARARNLHKCAQEVTREHNGCFPDSEAELQKLPGIGPYTAAAIASIAFDRAAVPIDGNIERVLARVHNIRTPLPGAKADIKSVSLSYSHKEAPGDFAQAMMDLGATVCTPRSPNCLICPIREFCEGTRMGDPEALPIKPAKKPKPTRRAVMYWISDEAGRIGLRRRPERGLLGGMMELPSTPWVEGEWPNSEAIASHAPVSADWSVVPGEVTHTFTHFHFQIRLVKGKIEAQSFPDLEWALLEQFDTYALPTVMKKAVRWALTDGQNV